MPPILRDSLLAVVLAGALVVAVAWVGARILGDASARTGPWAEQAAASPASVSAGPPVHAPSPKRPVDSEARQPPVRIRDRFWAPAGTQEAPPEPHLAPCRFEPAASRDPQRPEETAGSKPARTAGPLRAPPGATPAPGPCGS